MAGANREAAEQLLADIQANIEGTLEEGEFPVNILPAGEDKDSKSVSIGFRVSPWMDMLLKDLHDELKSIAPYKSDIARTFLYMGIKAWYNITKRRTNSIKLAMDAEHLRSARLRDEHARQYNIGQIKDLENLCRRYQKDGDYEYIVALLNDWVEIIAKEPDERQKTRYMRIMANHFEIPAIVKEARLRLGQVHTRKIDIFLGETSKVLND